MWMNDSEKLLRSIIGQVIWPYGNLVGTGQFGGSVQWVYKRWEVATAVEVLDDVVCICRYNDMARCYGLLEGKDVWTVSLGDPDFIDKVRDELAERLDLV